MSTKIARQYEVTHICETAGLVHLSHGAESDDIHTTIQQAHERTDEREERRCACYRVRRGSDLEHGENGPVRNT
jgi:hypothetical protein